MLPSPGGTPSCRGNGSSDSPEPVGPFFRKKTIIAVGVGRFVLIESCPKKGRETDQGKVQRSQDPGLPAVTGFVKEKVRRPESLPDDDIPAKRYAAAHPGREESLAVPDVLTVPAPEDGKKQQSQQILRKLPQIKQYFSGFPHAYNDQNSRFAARSGRITS